MKIMISQPMNGKSEDQIREERQSIIKDLEERGYEIVDTIFKEEVDKTYLSAPLYYLSKSIDTMGKVNTVYFMKGWESARGCKIEHEIALQYGLEIIEDYR